MHSNNGGSGMRNRSRTRCLATAILLAILWTAAAGAQKELARDLGIDPSTVRNIEAEHLPGPRIQALVDVFLAADRG